MQILFAISTLKGLRVAGSNFAITYKFSSASLQHPESLEDSMNRDSDLQVRNPMKLQDPKSKRYKRN